MSLESDGRDHALWIWKFVVRPGDPRTVETYPDGSTLEVEGCFAAALAESREAAIALLTQIAEEEGHDARWLHAANVIDLPIDRPKRIAWVIL